MIKNYNLPGAKAMFTFNKASTREIVTLAIVPSTAIKEVSHMILQMRQKRANFSPKYLYSDTCPNNDSFWKKVLGDDIVTRLGLFHLQHRIVETLDRRSELYWKCLVSLKKSIYTYNEDDEANLIRCLEDGTFSRDGKRHSHAEIDKIRHSKVWKQRCDPHLRKRILPGPTIRNMLHRWIVEWENKTDDEGRSVFGRDSKKVAYEQMKKVGYASDPPGEDMYQKVPAPPKSTHHLPKWISQRPEPALEQFHKFLVHLANTRTHSDLAAIITLGGVAGMNVDNRWEFKKRNECLQGKIRRIPLHFEDIAPFTDHSLPEYINIEAKKQGLSCFFDDVTPIREDCGEVFLSKSQCRGRIS